jgi:polar amino acid transport system substrate-binding protein
MKKFLAVLLSVVLLSVFVLSGCGAKGEGVKRVQEKKKLVMCTNAEFEPFEYKEGGETVGIDVDIAQEIATDLGVELEVLDMDFNSLINAVTGGKADIAIAGMTVNEERLKNVDFSDTYFNASQSIIVLKDSAIKASADLEGKIVGVQTGTTGDEYVTDNAKAAEVKRYSKGVDAVQDLIAGRIDAVVIDDYPATSFVSKNADIIVKLAEPMTKEEYAIAVNKNDTDLTKAINDTLKRIKDSGKLDEIIQKHSPTEE